MIIRFFTFYLPCNFSENQPSIGISKGPRYFVYGTHVDEHNKSEANHIWTQFEFIKLWDATDLILYFTLVNAH